MLGVYELTLPVADTNDTLLKIVKNIGANQTVVKVYHNETALTESTGGEPDGTGITGDQGYYCLLYTSIGLQLFEDLYGRQVGGNHIIRGQRVLMVHHK